MNEKIRVGLIGYGFSGRVFHAPVLTCVPGLELRSVVERSASASKERYPWVNVVRDARSLYEDEAIDLVVVATPGTAHFSIAREALLAGKHVIVEKPFTVTSSEADEQGKHKCKRLAFRRQDRNDSRSLPSLLSKCL